MDMKLKLLARLSFCLIAGLVTAGVAISQAPATRYLTLPDGSSYPMLEGESPEHATAAALKKYPEAFGFKPSGQYDADFFNSCVLKEVAKAKTTFAAAQVREACKHQATPKKCRSVAAEADRSSCVQSCKDVGYLSSSFGDCSKG